MVKGTEMLKDEHANILRVLAAAESLANRLEQGERVPQATLQDVLEFFHIFVGKCHDGKENEILFPALINKGILQKTNPMGHLLKEHKRGWSLLHKLGDATYDMQFRTTEAAQRWAHAARNYVEFLRRHIEEENELLLPEAEKVLGTEEQEALSSEFDKFQAVRIGLPIHDRMRRMVEDLAGRLAA